MFDLIKSDFDGYSGGSQGVFGLAKERLNGGYSGGLRGCSALQRSD